MLIDALIVSLIVGFLRGGKFTNLANLSLRKIGWVVSAFLIQYILVYGGERSWKIFINWGVYLHILSYLLVLLAIWYNREIRGMKIIGTGVLVNFFVILANDGKMPVSVSALSWARLTKMLLLLENKAYVLHTILTEESRLKFLADVIPLPPPYPRPRVMSGGDIIMAIGLFILIQHSMLKADKK